MSKTETSSIRAVERPLLWLDRFPLGALYRIALGWLVFPLSSWLWPGPVSLGRLTVVMVGVLLVLKFAPVVLRRLLPVSPCLREHWFKLRVLAKQYDSYQWRKLFWIGWGMAGSLLAGPTVDPAPPHYLLTGLCLGSGLAGLLVWRARHAALKRAIEAVASSRSSKPTPSQA